MKLVKACLSARKDLESSFHHCACPVKLAQVCLCAGKVYHCCFICRGSAVKDVQAC